jgi:hypothetical protein
MALKDSGAKGKLAKSYENPRGMSKNCRSAHHAAER